MSAYMQLRARGMEEGWWPQDDEDALAVAESETDVLEILDARAERVLAQELLAERAKARAKRLEESADRERRVIQEMVQVIGEKIVRPTYTASLSYRTKPSVVDEGAIPELYFRRKLDLLALGSALRAGEQIDGAVLSNPAPSLILKST
ncbi:MAG TPA: siphovirus Gp157 family protein [Ktedonobacterales bacterium]|nr:siphovirus Gp157 family protein [Ktedonobacterales bacterium]